ncbi:polysaccharide deacetylase family protein [Flavitalea sp.]|nr:polysaccharide deacetylase family protein [Flavitalea sp.]
MKLLKEAIAFFLIAVYKLRKSNTSGILSIYFHNPSKDIFHKVILWLANNKYQFISTKELELLLLTRKELTGKMVCITFDDGWKPNLELLPIIEKYRIPVTIFIPTDPVINGNYWFEYARIKRQRFLTKIKNVDEFKKLTFEKFYDKVALLKANFILDRSCIDLDELKLISEKELITIGSHTVSHPILKRCSVEVQRKELLHSKEILTKWLKKEIEYLAYPNGDYNSDTISIAKECGYKLCFTTFPAVIKVTHADPYLIPRYSINDAGGYLENIAKALGLWQRFYFKHPPKHQREA